MNKYLRGALIGAVGFEGVMITMAVAQTPYGVGPTAPASVNFTGVANTLVGFAFTIITGLIGVAIKNLMKDAASRAVYATAVKTALGALQTAIQDNLQTHPLQATVPGLTAPMAASVQYVLDHADDEIAWLKSRGYDITPEKIAAKISARTGETPTVQSVAPSGRMIAPILSNGSVAHG